MAIYDDLLSIDQLQIKVKVESRAPIFNHEFQSQDRRSDVDSQVKHD